MERLTKRSPETTNENGVCCTHFHSPECFMVEGNCSAGCKWEEAAWSRLAAYEDTRREPEEIDMDHEAAEQLRRLIRGRAQRTADRKRRERVSRGGGAERSGER